ncbi:MAG: type III secretion system export apparatus subunit SctR [bacterium]
MLKKIKSFLGRHRKAAVAGVLLYAGICLAGAGTLWAQGKFDQPVSKPLIILFALVALALVPILLTMITSFVKIAVVLALIRNAMGTQQIPPNQIITGLAMILTVYIMIPVGVDIYRETNSVIQTTSNQGLFSTATVGLMQEALNKGKEPMRAFLMKNASDKDRTMFYTLARKMRKPEDRDSIKNDDFMILIPSFVVSELSEAFQIGFVIFLPFLVIDMVVANILLALGMFQLSPITVSLPFKLLLFVLVDGWYLIARGLILGYT